jgi:uncharacterized membrane protein YfhO
MVDGWRVESVRANFAFQAVAVPAGKHLINRNYMPASFVLGSAISLTAVVFLILVAVIRKSIKIPDEIVEPA